jgi:membrane associated rhomboid family serine protease
MNGFLHAPTPNVASFLIVIIASYLFFALFGHTAIGIMIYNAMILDPDKVIYQGQLWRLITYGFLHDTSPTHVIFNAIAFYLIGPELEERWGEKRFFIFVMASIFTGGVLVTLSYLLGFSHGMVIGFSAATVALIVAWGLTFSHRQIYFFGILPLTGQQLVYVTVGIEILYAVSGNSISSAAHFGGILAAFILTLGLYKPRRLKEWYEKQKRK